MKRWLDYHFSLLIHLNAGFWCLVMLVVSIRFIPDWFARGSWIAAIGFYPIFLMISMCIATAIDEHAQEKAREQR